MAQHTAKLIPGKVVTIKFHAGYGNAEEIEDHEFVGLFPDGTGLPRINARFRTLGPKSYTWEAYRYAGRWCYGTSAQMLSVLTPKTPEK